MTHVVFWSPEADEKLQKLIHSADDRRAFLLCVREIDFWLARGPLDFGESRHDTVRLGVVAPLAVLFDVLDDPPTVIVLDIWRF
ncbi:MAG: hypothetical protein ACKO5R_11955 [Planctomycetaceae bacterium]